jgi:hypothetical protein
MCMAQHQVGQLYNKFGLHCNCRSECIHKVNTFLILLVASWLNPYEAVPLPVISWLENQFYHRKTIDISWYIYHKSWISDPKKRITTKLSKLMGHHLVMILASNTFQRVGPWTLQLCPQAIDRYPAMAKAACPAKLPGTSPMARHNWASHRQYHVVYIYTYALVLYK